MGATRSIEIPVEIADFVQTLATKEEQEKQIVQRLQVLDVSIAQKRSEMRDRYISDKAVRFTTFDWKAAVMGAEVAHTTRVLDSVVTIGMPSRSAEHELVRFAEDASPDVKAKLPLLGAEQVFLTWVRSIGLSETAKPQPFSTLPVTKRIDLMRGLPSVFISTVAAVCYDLELWIGYQLEKHSGN